MSQSQELSQGLRGKGNRRQRSNSVGGFGNTKVYPIQKKLIKVAATHRKWDSLRKQHRKANLLALKNGMNGGLGLGFWKMVTCCRPWHSKPCRDLRQRRVFMSHDYPLPLPLSVSPSISCARYPTQFKD